MSSYTYLCPDCDGWGLIVTNNGPMYAMGQDPAYDVEHECSECYGSGVIQLDELRDDLQRWSGDTGRAVEGYRKSRRQRDPLTEMQRERVLLLNGRPSAYSYQRRRATAPVLGQLRMIEAAIGCDLACRDAVQAWRKSA